MLRKMVVLAVLVALFAAVQASAASMTFSEGTGLAGKAASGEGTVTTYDARDFNWTLQSDNPLNFERVEFTLDEAAFEVYAALKDTNGSFLTGWTWCTTGDNYSWFCDLANGPVAPVSYVVIAAAR